MIDSVFSPFLSAQSPDVPIPSHILPALEHLEEQAAIALTAELDATLERIIQQAEQLITRKNVEGILDLNQGLGVGLQRPIMRLWEQGWLSGSEHALMEMREAVPESARLEVEQFRIPDEVAKLLRNLLQLTPASFRNLPAERAIQRRVLKLAGDFAKDTLAQVKTHLLAAIQVEPISRPVLLNRLQSTLNVARARAVTIARTETTNAYNQGRISTFTESRLVTHLIFYAIDDGRTTAICRSRAGMVIPITDKQAIARNIPPCHYSCRSTIGNLMPDLVPAHRRIVEDESRLWSNRKLVPLLKGWRTGA